MDQIVFLLVEDYFPTSAAFHKLQNDSVVHSN